MAASINRDIVFLLLQFLEEVDFKNTAHMLEKESGFLFNMRYFEEMINNGEWNEVESYLSSFTRFDENPHSTKIFFEIRKQKYLEALDKHDMDAAIEILIKDLKVFKALDHENLYNDMTMLLTYNNFREVDNLCRYTDAKSARILLFIELRRLIEANPVFHDKLRFPSFQDARLRALINQGISWQHHLCKNPSPNPVLRSLLVDHVCGHENSAQVSSSMANALIGPMSRGGGGFVPIEVPAASKMDIDEAGPSNIAQPLHVQVDEVGPSNARLLHMHVDEAGPSTNAAGSLLQSIGHHTDASSQDDVPVNPMVSEKGKSMILTTVEMKERSQLRSLKLPDSLSPVRIVKLVYTNSGGCILALTCNAIHKLWKWRRNYCNKDGMATTDSIPQLRQPAGELVSMTNDVSDTNLEVVRVPCFSLSNNDMYLTSSSGGNISLFNTVTFKKLSTFMAPPPPATSLAFFPPDNNFVAIGREDSSILIYNIRVAQVIAKLNGHGKRVTALAFPLAGDVLVSLGDDAKLCLWSTNEWKLKASKRLPVVEEHKTNLHTQSRLQFHRDQIHILVFHRTMIAIYKASKLECINEWFSEGSNPAITDATFSCVGHSIYATFDDGSVAIFFAPEMQIRCRINPTAYIGWQSPSSRIYPSVVAAHPFEPNQFAVGLTNGALWVLEPLETEENWGVARAQLHDGAGPSRVRNLWFGI